MTPLKLGRIVVLLSIIRTGIGLTNFANTKCGQRSVDIIPKANRISRILGGAVALRGEFPWIVSLQYNTGPPESSHFCGGFLINNRHVLTAAHCFQSVTKDRMHVIVGEHIIGIEEVPLNAFAVSVERIIQHPDYSGDKAKRNDIAIIRLQDTIEFNRFVQPACLPNAGEFVPVGEKTTVAGWGYTDIPEISKTLMTVDDIPVVSPSKCEEDYKWTGTDGELCAGVTPESGGACKGDSGSPMMRWEKSNASLSVVGIHSGGDGTGCVAGMRSGIYTRLSSYVNWIKYNVA